MNGRRPSTADVSVRIGYNHDIRYQGRSFHIQTEDSGHGKGRIFTHVFHAGTIVATSRVDYEQGTPTTDVVALLRESHKAMARKLARGLLDDAIGRTTGLEPRPGWPLTVIEPAPAVVESPQVEASSDEMAGAAEAAGPAGAAGAIGPAEAAGPVVSSERATPLQRAVAALGADDVEPVLEGLYRGLPGTLGVALADYESGLCLGVVGSPAGLDLELAAAGSMEVMKAKAGVLRMLGLEGGIEDVLVTLDAQYHVICPVGSVLFLYLVMDRERGNLAMGRLKLGAAASELLQRLAQWAEPGGEP